MWRELNLQSLSAGVLAAFVGFASSFAIVIKGLEAVGASPAEAASGLMALSIAMGLCAIILSAMTRMPISIAWSTPGAALLASSGMADGGFAAAVGAFLVCAAMLIVAGTWSRLGRWVARIPPSLANAMLAGVLLSLCLAPARAVAVSPGPVLAVIAVWFAVLMVRRLYAVPAAVAATVLIIVLGMPPDAMTSVNLVTSPVPVSPVFTFSSIIGIALPLFLVTMASQNLPGLAVLNANGYRPQAARLIRTTGLFSLLAAPFGGHAVNLAAITAALCAGPEAGPDPARRYWAAVISGGVYILFGLMAGAVMALVSAAPPLLIEAVAGLALLGSFGAAITAAMAEAKSREAAVVTFVVTASGLSFAGIGGAFWGIVAGGTMLAMTHWRENARS